MSFASYALAQLAAAFRFSSDSPRVRQWRDVLEGLSSGRLTVGSRTPVGGTPDWVTLEVAHGGFATGQYRAGGPLLPHERAWLSALDAPADESARQSLNQHFLSDAGRQALREMLDTGDYRVDVPEEAALLVVTWLLDRGAHAEAATLVETILPFADRLRFYPRPAARVDDGGDRVHLRSAHEVAASLREVRAQAQVLAMNEALSVWAPLADRAVALWLERVVGERPRFVDGRAIGTLDDDVDEEWLARVRAFLADDAAARARARCTKHLREKSTYHRLHAGLATRVRRPLDEGERARVLHALAGRLDKHGAPNDEAHRVRRAAERAHASRPTHRAIGALVAARIEASGEPDDGRPELDAALGPVCANEVVAPVPRSIVDKAQRCLSAPLPTLIARGVLRSGEMLAMVSPQRTARVSARHFGAAAGDARLEALYRRVQLAFARRRSLLLLDLQHQTRLRELPWIAALHRTVGAKSDEVFARAARDVRASRGLHVTTYPQTILPNPLVAELRNLASSAGLDPPFTEEIAADIFMGTFSAKFAKAAQRASEQLHGSLYARLRRRRSRAGLDARDQDPLGRADLPGVRRALPRARRARGPVLELRRHERPHARAIADPHHARARARHGRSRRRGRRRVARVARVRGRPSPLGARASGGGIALRQREERRVRVAPDALLFRDRRSDAARVRRTDVGSGARRALAGVVPPGARGARSDRSRRAVHDGRSNVGRRSAFPRVERGTALGARVRRGGRSAPHPCGCVENGHQNRTSRLRGRGRVGASRHRRFAASRLRRRCASRHGSPRTLSIREAGELQSGGGTSPCPRAIASAKLEPDQQDDQRDHEARDPDRATHRGRRGSRVRSRSFRGHAARLPSTATGTAARKDPGPVDPRALRSSPLRNRAPRPRR
ncbi:MAG: hypothetical protein R3B99_02835 [Polyangiales bacterium]